MILDHNSVPSAQVLHEQQLGWAWRPPSDDIFNVGGSAAEAQDQAAADDAEAAAAATERAEAELAERLHDARYAGVSGRC